MVVFENTRRSPPYYESLRSFHSSCQEPSFHSSHFPRSPPPRPPKPFSLWCHCPHQPTCTLSVMSSSVQYPGMNRIQTEATSKYDKIREPLLKISCIVSYKINSYKIRIMHFHDKKLWPSIFLRIVFAEINFLTKYFSPNSVNIICMIFIIVIKWFGIIKTINWLNKSFKCYDNEKQKDVWQLEDLLCVWRYSNPAPITFPRVCSLTRAIKRFETLIPEDVGISGI